ncbi:TPA: hypothetical protein DIS55_00255 [Candidatus Kaiserbacteria bacterium]|nr:hypothetical protein [Candidatus Kaiserbacteria bacterium]
MKENSEGKGLGKPEADSALPKGLDKQREEILREGTPKEMLAALGANEMYSNKNPEDDDEDDGVTHKESSESL